MLVNIESVACHAVCQTDLFIDNEKDAGVSL